MGRKWNSELWTPSPQTQGHLGKGACRDKGVWASACMRLVQVRRLQAVLTDTLGLRPCSFCPVNHQRAKLTRTPELRTRFLHPPARKSSWCLFTGPGCSWGSVEMKGAQQPPKAVPVQCCTGATLLWVGRAPSEALGPAPLRSPAALPWVLGSQTLGAADCCYQQSPQWTPGECLQ